MKFKIDRLDFHFHLSLVYRCVSLLQATSRNFRFTYHQVSEMWAKRQRIHDVLQCKHYKVCSLDVCTAYVTHLLLIIISLRYSWGHKELAKH